MKFRVARHTNNLNQLEIFYTTIVGLTVLGSFENHNEYNGVFIGKPNSNWHLEFTQSNEELVQHTFDDDDILVFYPESQEEYNTILNNISQHNIQKITPKNPYWINNGVMITDPDGYKVIISNLKI